MSLAPNHTVNIRPFPWQAKLIGVVLFMLVSVSQPGAATPEEYSEDQIEIIEGDDRTIYEYRQNGVLTMIKIVPEKGRAYYMVPADGAARFEGLDHERQLYPQWIIKEW